MIRGPGLQTAVRAGLATLVVLVGSACELLAQQCIGPPLDAGEQAIGVRLDLDELSILSGEYSRAAASYAWSVLAGVAADELIPPGDAALALGGGAAWTGLHRAVCPAFSFWTAAEGDLRRTRARLGVGVGRRLGEERIRGAAFLLPHVRIVHDEREVQGEDFDDTRYEL